MLMVTKKLQHYFTDHEVTVVTSFPLGEVVHSCDATRRISKWVLELMGYDIKYAPSLDCHQVAGLGQLHGQVDGGPNPDSEHRP
jgi:hypothetical protein